MEREKVRETEDGALGQQQHTDLDSTEDVLKSTSLESLLNRHPAPIPASAHAAVPEHQKNSLVWYECYCSLLLESSTSNCYNNNNY